MQNAVDARSAVDHRLAEWRQGDLLLPADVPFIHLASGRVPLTEQSHDVVSGSPPESTGSTESDLLDILTEVEGHIILTQTCDIVRSCQERPFLQLAPLIPVDEQFLADVQRLRRPAFATVPAAAERGLVADLDRCMTVEKSVLAVCHRTPGWATDEQVRGFAQALARVRSRFAFPDDFVRVIQNFRAAVFKRHGKNHDEGRHLDALDEIRVQAHPGWHAPRVQLIFWFIKRADPVGCEPAWHEFAEQWTALVDASGRFESPEAIVCTLEDLRAVDYLRSDRLDYDQLSGPAAE